MDTAQNMGKTKGNGGDNDNADKETHEIVSVIRSITIPRLAHKIHRAANIFRPSILILQLK
jgi:hypothetical protein